MFPSYIYISLFINSYSRRLIDLSVEEIEKGDYDGRVVVDGASGFGGQKLLELMKLLPPEMEISLRNSGKSGKE